MSADEDFRWEPSPEYFEGSYLQRLMARLRVRDVPDQSFSCACPSWSGGTCTPLAWAWGCGVLTPGCRGEGRGRTGEELQSQRQAPTRPTSVQYVLQNTWVER